MQMAQRFTRMGEAGAEPYRLLGAQGKAQKDPTLLVDLLCGKN